MKIGLSSDIAVDDRHVDDRVLEDPDRGCCACPASPTSPIWGERIEMLQVQVDPERLQANGVSLDR